MFAGRLTQATLRALDWLAARTLAARGHAGAPAYRPPRRRGRLFLPSAKGLRHHRPQLPLPQSSWRTRSGRMGRDVLCFIEVKTRTTRDVKPAEAAVDRDKQRELSMVARDFLRQMPPFVPVAFRRARRIL
jgi:hypothetical protein